MLQVKKIVFATFFALLFGVNGFACTVIIGHKNGRVIVGNNEDWYNSNSKYWIEHPEKDEKYSACFFGFNGEGKYPQGGFNEKGLFFDGTYVPRTAVDRDLVKTKGLKAASIWSFKRVLKNAQNIKEAKEMLEPFFYPFIKEVQIIIVDNQGNYLVIKTNGIAEEGQVKEGEYKIITNFHSEQLTDNTYSCYRYDLADEYLSSDFQNSNEQFETALYLTHQEYPAASVYSNIYNLTNSRVNLYYNYDFVNPHSINLNQDIDVIEKQSIEGEIFKKRMVDQLGKLYKKKGVAEAITFYRNQRQIESEYLVSVQELIDFAEHLFIKGEWTDYFEVLNQANLLFPDSDSIYEALGKYYLRTAQIDKAFENYQKALQLNKNNFWAKDMIAQYSDQNTSQYVIQLEGYENAKKVMVSGEFNEWLPIRNVCIKEDDVWKTKVRAKPGTYDYVFIVDGERVKLDVSKKEKYMQITFN